jgi:lipoprotein-anchoring transpeptidase ErfK/SrfK
MTENWRAQILLDFMLRFPTRTFLGRPCRTISAAIGVALISFPLNASGQARKPIAVAFTEKSIEASITKFPLKIPKSGPAALQLQILLDRAGFSPGIIDGTWGTNAAKAITFFTKPDDTGRLDGDSPPEVTSVDLATYDRLRSAAPPKPLLRWYTVTAADLAGPFTPIPEEVYDQAKLKCLCYSSPGEALGERFHTSPKFLAQLNPKVKLDALKPGAKLLVPNVELDGSALPQDTAIAARLIISKKKNWTHVVDSNGRIIYHFPSTLGAGYDPSPSGDFKVTDVSHDTPFRYQPKLFSEVPDSEPEALLPPGPNSPVGIVWISLSKKHYGIHGTSSPETIGYASSHGCVRLTNWDAWRLSQIVESGTPVSFR